MKLDINLHQAQWEIFNSKARVRVVCAGRGFGKTRYIRACAIRSVFSFKGRFDPESPQEALLVAPTLKMVRQLHWDSLLTLFENNPLVDHIDKSFLKIYFKNNLPSLGLAGVDDGGERIRGKNLIYAGLEEYQLFPSKTWNEIIRPCFRDPSGFYQADVIGTPKGKNSHFYQFHLQALNTPDWQYFHFISKDNPFYPRTLLEQARLTLPPKVFRSEMEASWEDFDGQLFDQFNDNHIVSELPTEFDTVLIGLDHGEVNPAIAVIGILGNKYFIIDAWMNSNPQVSVPAEEFHQKVADYAQRYNAHRVFSPDDRPSVVTTLRRIGLNKNIAGLKRAVTSPRNKPGVMEGVGLLNSLFYQNRLFISVRLTDFIDEIRSYHRAQDKDGLFLEKPAEGQSDHRIDALRYVCPLIEIKHDLNGISRPIAA
jgi:hypothetical protein